MNHVRKKLLVGGTVLAVALGYLAYRGVAAGKSYYMSVDAYLADPSCRGQRVRLHGFVAGQNLSTSVQDGLTAFELSGESRRVRVRYTGVVPDTFRAGGEVVVTGRMGPDGVFEARELLTKCASKYEMKQMAKERPV
ncbi:MAG: cytochrome c maturation protein CcmE [Planctomycetota bacterium]|jgi:cytochrome c-type biogenesis protein CcmE